MTLSVKEILHWTACGTWFFVYRALTYNIGSTLAVTPLVRMAYIFFPIKMRTIDVMKGKLLIMLLMSTMTLITFTVQIYQSMKDFVWCLGKTEKRIVIKNHSIYIMIFLILFNNALCFCVILWWKKKRRNKLNPSTKSKIKLTTLEEDKWPNHQQMKLPTINN